MARIVMVVDIRSTYSIIIFHFIAHAMNNFSYSYEQLIQIHKLSCLSFCCERRQSGHHPDANQMSKTKKEVQRKWINVRKS